MHPIKRLRFERKTRRISQQVVEAVSGLSQPLISLAERGRYIPSPAQLERLADVFDVHPAADLLKDVVVVERSR